MEGIHGTTTVDGTPNGERTLFNWMLASEDLSSHCSGRLGPVCQVAVSLLHCDRCWTTTSIWETGVSAGIKLDICCSCIKVMLSQVMLLWLVYYLLIFRIVGRESQRDAEKAMHTNLKVLANKGKRPSSIISMQTVWFVVVCSRRCVTIYSVQDLVGWPASSAAGCGI